MDLKIEFTEKEMEKLREMAKSERTTPKKLVKKFILHFIKEFHFEIKQKVRGRK